jgi:hypothetical protein
LLLLSMSKQTKLQHDA